MKNQLEPLLVAPAAPPRGPARRPDDTALRGDLGTFDIVAMVLAYAGPLAVVGLQLSFVIGYGVGVAR